MERTATKCGPCDQVVSAAAVLKRKMNCTSQFFGQHGQEVLEVCRKLKIQAAIL